MSAELGVAYLSIAVEASKIAPTITKAFDGAGGIGDKAGAQAGTSFGGSLKKMLLKAGALVGVAKIVGGAISGGFNRAINIENARKKLEGLGHSIANVDSIMESALKSVKGTAYGLGDAATVAATLAASNIKVGDNMTRTLTAVADVAAISGRSLTDVGAIFSKIAAKGYMDGHNLNQLVEAGIPVLDLLGKKLGKTQAEVSLMVRNSQIDFATFQEAMEAGMGGSALKTGETFQGALANMQAALSRFTAAIIAPGLDAARTLFNNLIPPVDTLTEKIKPLAKAIGGKLNNGLTYMFKGIGLVSQSLGTLGAMIKHVLRPLGLYLKDNRKAKTAIDDVSDAIDKGLSVWNKLASGIGKVAGVVYRFFDTYVAQLEATGQKIGTLANSARDAFSILTKGAPANGWASMKMAAPAVQKLIALHQVASDTLSVLKTGLPASGSWLGTRPAEVFLKKLGEIHQIARNAYSVLKTGLPTSGTWLFPGPAEKLIKKLGEIRQIARDAYSVLKTGMPTSRSWLSVGPAEEFLKKLVEIRRIAREAFSVLTKGVPTNGTWLSIAPADKFVKKIDEIRRAAGGVKKLLFTGENDGSIFGMREGDPIINTIDRIRGAVLDVKAGLEGAGGKFGDIIKNVAGIGQALSPVSLIFAGLKPLLPDIIEAVGKIIEVFGNLAKDALPKVVEAAGRVTGGATDLMAALAPVLDLAVELAPKIAELAGKIVDAAVSILPSVTDMATGFATDVIPVLIDFAEKVLPPVLDGLGKIADFLKDHPDLAAAAVAGFVGFKTAKKSIDVVKTSVGKVTGAVKTAKETFAKFKTGIGKVKTVIESAGKKFNTFKTGVGKVTDGIGKMTSKAGEWIQKAGGITKQTFIDGLGKVAGGFKKVGSALKRVGAAMAANPLGLIIAGVALLVAGLVWFFTKTELGRKIWSKFVDFLVGAWEWLKELAIKTFHKIADFLSGLWEKISSTAVTVWEAVKDFFVDLWENKIVGNAIMIFGKIHDFLVGLWDKISSAAVTAWGAVKDFFVDLWENKIVGNAKAIFEKIHDFLVGLWGKIRSSAEDAWAKVKSAVMTPVSALRDWLQSVWDKISGAASKMADGIKGFFSNGFGALAGIIKSPINGVISLINGAIGSLNKISVDIPSFVPIVGGKHFGIHIPLIPMLAKGATIMPRTGGTLALLAEAGRPESVVDTGGMNRLIDETTMRLVGDNQSDDAVDELVVLVRQLVTLMMVAPDELADLLKQIRDNQKDRRDARMMGVGR